MLTSQQKEDLRHAALEALAVRSPSALTVQQIWRACKKEIPFLFEASDLEGPLAFLKDAGHAKVDFDGLGSTQYWSISAPGTLYYERNLK